MNLDIEKICPLHGPILNENLVHYIENIIFGAAIRLKVMVCI